MPTTAIHIAFSLSLLLEQVSLLLGALDLGDHAGAFAAARLNGRKLQHCLTREELKEIGIDMGNIDFRTLRTAVVDYTSSGVPATLLEEAAAKGNSREEEAARQREEKEWVNIFGSYSLISRFTLLLYHAVCCIPQAEEEAAAARKRAEEEAAAARKRAEEEARERVSPTHVYRGIA